MEAKIFKPRYLPTIQSWLVDRDLPAELAEDMPWIGYLIEIKKRPIAAGFLRQIENSKLGLIEGFVTDPRAENTLRDQALDFLVEVLIQKAKKLKLKHLMAWTTVTSIVDRSLKHQFKKMPHQLIGLDLAIKKEGN